MREIKFRAWNKKDKEMRIPMDIWDVHLWVGKPSDYILMQYIGLKDKNGKEIWEGDIIKSPVWKWINKMIKFQEASFVIANSRSSNYRPSKVLSHHKIRHQNIEIIGNIYENPEFLKED